MQFGNLEFNQFHGKNNQYTTIQVPNYKLFLPKITQRIDGKKEHSVKITEIYSYKNFRESNVFYKGNGEIVDLTNYFSVRVKQCGNYGKSWKIFRESNGFTK